MAFGDIRVAERADWLIERVATAGTLVLRKLGETRPGEKAICRDISATMNPNTNIFSKR